MRAIEVRTESVPSHEVPFTDVPSADTDQDLPGLADLILDMKDLAEISDDDLAAGLAPLVTAYRDWIDGQEATLAVPVVLMRYTLRLLTIQQFQRAAALICAAEVIRRSDPATWNTKPFRIGLWVGSRVTPNRTSDAADWLKQQRGAKGAPSRALGSPHQLTACPWCGAGLEPGRDIAVDAVSRRTLVTCPDSFCEFGMNLLHDEGLPVVVVDEEIYRLLPSLVIGTVDKFAQLTWRGETQALFGRVSRRCARHGYVTDDLMATDWELTTDTSQHPAKNHHPAARIERVPPLRPPDLIIQDELHLISGPLGSLVGLYEAAVDRLGTWEIIPNGSGLLSSARWLRCRTCETRNSSSPASALPLPPLSSLPDRRCGFAHNPAVRRPAARGAGARPPYRVHWRGGSVAADVS